MRKRGCDSATSDADATLSSPTLSWDNRSSRRGTRVLDMTLQDRCRPLEPALFGLDTDQDLPVLDGIEVRLGFFLRYPKVNQSTK